MNTKIRRLPLLILLITVTGAAWVVLLPDGASQIHAASTTPAAEATESDKPAPGRIIFNRDIRPILADRCFSCHGPDPNKRQAGLRLDRPDAALGALPKHPNLRAFVPGHPDHSEALRRILSTDPVSVMPPATSHLKLNAAEKELIRQWVVQGGPYQEHWAFTAPLRPPVPAVQNASWAHNDIDRFVLANLEANGLAPSPQADKATLIRRVSLDLTGIPPSAAEVDAFLADNSPDAYEKVVDRLLASPRYGEQMAVQWLDYSRYADSHGYQSDPERHMWKWRDWVINAYNSNMPFDQFAIKQLAGDLLPNATIDDRVATGFNRNHRITDEGGVINEEWRVEGVIDRVSTTSAVFMGLTMECCRCHDHKYDPITQKEFYSFSAYFNSVNEIGVGPTGPTDQGINVPPILKVPSQEQQQQLDLLSTKINDAGSKLAELRKGVDDRAAKLDLDQVPADPTGLVVRFPLDGTVQAQDEKGTSIQSKYVGKGNPQFNASPFGKAIHFDGIGTSVNAGQAIAFDSTDKFSYGGWIKRGGDGAMMSKMNSSDSFRGFDLLMSGGRVAVHIIHHWNDNALKVQTRKALGRSAWNHIFVTYDGSSRAAGVKIYINGKLEPVDVLNDNLVGTIKTTSPLLIGMRDGSDIFTGDVADARFYDRLLSPTEIGLLARGSQVRAILKVPTTQRSPEMVREVGDYVESTDPEMAKVTADEVKLRSDRAAVEKMVPDTMVMQDLPKPRDTFILLRGQYDKHGEKVEPGVPAVLPPLPKDAPPNRLGLARWIVDPGNPLTARVQVNRLWEKFFGVGIVKTSENFGTQTEWPSNPELLDWLATEFVRLHWDMKAMQKEMVMSAAYQQASEMKPEMAERDPENRLIARGPRFRLTAEEIRDQALADSGLLVEKVGGPSARPYEPADLWSGNSFGNLARYVDDKGDGLYRRSIYTFIKRSAVPANLSLFDQPSREYCVIRRSRTDTPLQALDLMNDPTYVEASRVMAQHLMSDEKGTPAQRIAVAFKRVTSREPTVAEMEILSAGFEKNLANFQKDPAGAAKLVSIGATPRDAKLDVPELAAYTMTSSIILNLDETVTRQ
jgi:mono/diheme cytochrome c family protein